MTISPRRGIPCQRVAGPGKPSRVRHPAVPGRPDQQVQAQLLGLDKEIEDVAFPVGHTDQPHLGRFPLELRRGFQARQPFMAFLGGNGPTAAAAALAKILSGSFPHQMVGQTQRGFLRRGQQGGMIA